MAKKDERFKGFSGRKLKRWEIGGYGFAPARECNFCAFALDANLNQISKIEKENVTAKYCPYKKCPIPLDLFPEKNRENIIKHEGEKF